MNDQITVAAGISWSFVFLFIYFIYDKKQKILKCHTIFKHVSIVAFEQVNPCWNQVKSLVVSLLPLSCILDPLMFV